MMNFRAILFFCLLNLLAVVCVNAQETNSVGKNLAAVTNAIQHAAKPFRMPKLGDPAPALAVGSWVKGQPVKIQPGTNIFVLVFCTLSRASDLALTNLNELQKIYESKGLVAVVISDEPPDELKNFVSQNASEINYRVAADDVGRKTTSDYQTSFRQMMLPRAYVVGKDATVLWYGHPLRDDLGQVVDDLLSGRYDMAQTQKRVTTREQLEQYLFLAREQDPVTPRLGRMLLNIRTNDAAGLLELASKIATDPGLKKRDAVLANAALDRSAQLSATNATDIALTRAILLFQTGQEEAGLAKAKQALAEAKKPEAIDEIQVCIRAMEKHLAQKAAQTNSPASTH